MTQLQAGVTLDQIRQSKGFAEASQQEKREFLRQVYMPTVSPSFSKAPIEEQDAYLDQEVMPLIAPPPTRQANPALDFLGQLGNTALQTGSFGLVNRPEPTNELAGLLGGLVGGAVPVGGATLLGGFPAGIAAAAALGGGTSIRDQYDEGRTDINIPRVLASTAAGGLGQFAGGRFGTTLIKDALINAGFNAGEVAGIQALEGMPTDLGQILKAAGIGVGATIGGRGASALLSRRNKAQAPAQPTQEQPKSMLEQAEPPTQQVYSIDGMSNRALEDVATLASQEGVTDKDVLTSAYKQRKALLDSTTKLKKQGLVDSEQYKERTKARQAIERVIQSKTGEKTPKKDKDVTKLGYDATPRPRLVQAQKQVQATLLKQPIGQLPARQIQALPSMTEGQQAKVQARVKQGGTVLPPSQEVIDVKGKRLIPQPTQGNVPKAMTGKPAEQARAMAGERAKATQEAQTFATVIKKADAVPDDASRLRAYKKLRTQAQNKLIAEPTNTLAKQRLETIQGRIDAMTETATNKQVAQGQLAQKAKIKPAVVDDTTAKVKEPAKITPKEAGQLLTELYSGDHVGVVDNQKAYEVFEMLGVPVKKVNRDNITSSDVTRFGDQLVFNANLGRQLGMQRIGENERLGVVITRLQKQYPNLNVASIIGGRVVRDPNVLATIGEDVAAVQKAGESLPDNLVSALERGGLTEQAKREAQMAVPYEKLDRFKKAGFQNMDRAQTPEALDAAFDEFNTQWKGLEADFKALKDEKAWMDAFNEASERWEANSNILKEAQALGAKPVEPVAPKPKAKPAKPVSKAEPKPIDKPAEVKPVDATGITVQPRADGTTPHLTERRRQLIVNALKQDMVDQWFAGENGKIRILITKEGDVYNARMEHRERRDSKIDREKNGDYRVRVDNTKFKLKAEKETVSNPSLFDAPTETPKAKFIPQATDEGKLGTRYTTPNPDITVRKGVKGNWVVETKQPDGKYGDGVRVADEATAKVYVAKADVLAKTAEVKAKIKDPVNPAKIHANASKVEQLLPLVPDDKKPLVKAFFKAVADGKLINVETFAEKFGLTVGDDPYQRLDYPYDGDVNPKTGDVLLKVIRQTDGQPRTRLVKEGQLGFVQREGVMQIPKDTEVKSEITSIKPSDKEVMYRPSYEPDADGKPQLQVRDRDGNIVEQVEAKSVPISGWLADRLTRPEPFEKADIRRAGEEIANMPDLRQVEEVMAKFPEAQRDALRKLVTGLRCQK